MSQLFSKRANIELAYVGWIFDPASGQPPHYIFALAGKGDIKAETYEAAPIVRKYLRQEDIFDFIIIDNNGGLSDYFLKESSPFYKKINLEI